MTCLQEKNNEKMKRQLQQLHLHHTDPLRPHRLRHAQKNQSLEVRSADEIKESQVNFPEKACRASRSPWEDLRRPFRALHPPPFQKPSHREVGRPA